MHVEKKETLMEFNEVWKATSQVDSHQFYSAPLIVGVLFVLIETIALVRRKKYGENDRIFMALNSISHPKYPRSKAFIPIGILLIGLGIVLFANSLGQNKEIEMQMQ